MTCIRICKMTALMVVVLLVAAALAHSSTNNGQEDKPATGAVAADIEKGRVIYNKRCGVCHFAASGAKKIGPGLKGLSKRETFSDGKPITDDSLRVWIENGGKNMPGFKAVLNAEQVRNLIAYLKTL